MSERDYRGNNGHAVEKVPLIPKWDDTRLWRGHNEERKRFGYQEQPSNFPPFHPLNARPGARSHFDIGAK